MQLGDATLLRKDRMPPVRPMPPRSRLFPNRCAANLRAWGAHACPVPSALTTRSAYWRTGLFRARLGSRLPILQRLRELLVAQEFPCEVG